MFNGIGTNLPCHPTPHNTSKSLWFSELITKVKSHGAASCGKQRSAVCACSMKYTARNTMYPGREEGGRKKH